MVVQQVDQKKNWAEVKLAAMLHYLLVLGMEIQTCQGQSL
jgi:hypothetical protein